MSKCPHWAGHNREAHEIIILTLRIVQSCWETELDFRKERINACSLWTSCHEFHRSPEETIDPQI
jgi:hypothetical protein